MFFKWINEGEEKKQAFLNSAIMQIWKRYLGGNWTFIRKVRLVRFIRKLITEVIIVRGVKEIFEEGVRILGEMEGEEEERGNEGEEGEEEDEHEYMFELYLLKVRGIQKKMIEEAIGRREDESR